jgi:hypothetical protein
MSSDTINSGHLSQRLRRMQLPDRSIIDPSAVQCEVFRPVALASAAVVRRVGT